MTRLLLAALTAICLSVPARAQSNRPVQPQQQPQATQQPSAPDYRGTAQQPLIVRPLPTPKTEAEAAQEKADREDVSSANWWMVRLTGVIGFIGFVQLVVFGIQAKRLKDTISTMERTERRQLRAYVGVENIRFEIVNIEKNYISYINRNPPYIYDDFTSIVIKNYGVTPAYNVRTRTGLMVIPHLGRAEPGYDFDATFRGPVTVENMIARGFIQGGQSEISKSPIADATAVWNAEKQQAGLIVFGRIWYDDAFGRNWSTKYCYVWEPWHPPGPRFVPYAEFNGEDQDKGN